jgi:hypothetical protein
MIELRRHWSADGSEEARIGVDAGRIMQHDVPSSVELRRRAQIDPAQLKAKSAESSCGVLEHGLHLRMHTLLVPGCNAETKALYPRLVSDPTYQGRVK